MKGQRKTIAPGFSFDLGAPIQWMGRLTFFLTMVMFLIVPLSCGYTTKQVLPSNTHSIAVRPFENQTFEPGLEIDLNQELTDRILFEGAARLEPPSHAQAILTGKILEYRREPLRYTDAQDVQEYRLKLIADAILEKPETHEVLWEEHGFTGEATFFTSGSLAKNETDARKALLEDISRRLVTRLAESQWE